MRSLPILLYACSLLAQRTAQICILDSCSSIDTARIGGLRFEDYKVTNANAPLTNLDIRRSQLIQLGQGTQTLLCAANPNAGNILNAPIARFSAVSAEINEVETLSTGGQLVQEVYAQATVSNFLLSDGYSIPQLSFRLSRNRGSAQIVFSFGSYVLAFDPATGRLIFLTALPTDTQTLRVFWSVVVNLSNLLNANAGFKIPNPTPFNRPLFTADEVRGLADTFSRAVFAYALPTYSPDNGDALALNGAEYLATRGNTPARVLATNLTAWAKSNAAASTAILKPIALFWPTLQQDPIVSASDRDMVNVWLQPLYKNNTDVSVKAIDAIVRRDNLAFAESVERYFIAINQLRADGSIPDEAQRGPCALSSTNIAINNLVSIAESAAAQGYDLYSISVNDRTLHTAIQFLLDAYDNFPLIAKYNNPNASCYLSNSAPIERKVFDPATATAWIEIYLARFPNTPLANRLRTRAGLNGLTNRPLSSAAAGVNTSCLFLTPQELAPVNLPNLDILSGDNQSAATNTTLPDKLSARVRGNAGNPIPNLLVNFAVTAGAATIDAASALTDPLGIATTRLTLGGRSGQIRVAASALGIAPVVFTATARGDDPKLSPDGIAGVGGSIPSVRTASPGAILSIYGADFVAAGMGRRVRADEILSNRLPTAFNGICVFFDTTSAYMLDVYPNQLNIVVPAFSGTSAQVRVAKNCGTPNEQRTDAQTIAVSTAAPEFFSFQPTSSGNNPVAAVDAVTGEFFGPLNLFGGIAKPAKPGDYVTVYLTGLGATTPAVLPGALSTSAASLRSIAIVKLAGQNIAAEGILYAGFSPGSLIYQINFRVPPGLPANNQPISVTVDGQTTPPGAYLTLALR